MRKHYLLLLLLAYSIGFSQHKVGETVMELNQKKATFRAISFFTERSGNALAASYSRAVSKATLATVNTPALEDLLSKKYEYVETGIPYQGETLMVQLYKVSPMADNFTVKTSSNRAVTYQQGGYYRGIIKGKPHSLVSLNFFRNHINGVISDESLGNIVIGKPENLKKTLTHMIYAEKDLTGKNPFTCQKKTIGTAGIPGSLTPNNAPATTNKCVAMYFEIDNDLFAMNGADVTETLDWFSGVFNNVQALYANDAISIALKTVFVWDTDDPYAGNESGPYLDGFVAQRPVFDGDMAQLVGADGGMGGLAFVNSLCANFNYGYSDLDTLFYASIPVYSWNIHVIAHELGHSLGSDHTHDCVWNGNNTPIDSCVPTDCGAPAPVPTEGGTIMSYCHANGVGVNFAFGFGPQPRTLIQNTVNAAGCLSSDCISSCVNNISGFSIANITETGALAQLTMGFEAASEIAVFPLQSTASPVWMPVSSQNHIVSGLSPNTYYKAIVRRQCSGTTAPTREKVFVTGANYCAGVSITDSGGAENEYTNDENIVRVIIPGNADDKVKITFTEFDVEEDYDFLHIYNGSDVNAPELTPGGLSGTVVPPAPFISTADNGALTLKFTSDYSSTRTGYVALVSCESGLNTNDTSYIDFTYSPNPTENTVHVSATSAIENISVYDIMGKRLKAIVLNRADATVNIGDLSAGVYIFKMQTQGRLVEFKVIKK